MKLRVHSSMKGLYDEDAAVSSNPTLCNLDSKDFELSLSIFDNVAFYVYVGAGVLAASLAEMKIDSMLP